MTTTNSNLPIDAKIFVAGHRGLAGSAIVRRLLHVGCTNIVTRTRNELNLTDQRAVEEFFARERIDQVYLAAAKVGGILANESFPAEYIWENLAIQTNVIRAAYKSGVKRLLFLGSSCIYPRDCPQPIHEDYLLSGPLELTNRPYAVAKIAGIEMCWAFNRQFHTQFVAAMPTNLYGPNDNYDLSTSHVLPALLRKMHEAKAARANVVSIWGTGLPRREFLHSDDLADACVFLMNLPDHLYARILSSEAPPLVNVGCGNDLEIRELAELIREVVGYQGDLSFDATKPDGTPRKLLDISKLAGLGWTSTIGLREGIESVYLEYSSAPSRLLRERQNLERLDQ